MQVYNWAFLYYSKAQCSVVNMYMGSCLAFSGFWVMEILLCSKNSVHEVYINHQLRLCLRSQARWNHEVTNSSAACKWIGWAQSDVSMRCTALQHRVLHVWTGFIRICQDCHWGNDKSQTRVRALRDQTRDVITFPVSQFLNKMIRNIECFPGKGTSYSQ